MGRYLIRRVLFMILVLFVVSLITFIIFVKLPASDPARRAAGQQTTAEQIEAAARHAFGLDRPLYVQYGRFAKGLIPGRACSSTRTSTTRTRTSCRSKEEIFSRLPVTITLAVGRGHHVGPDGHPDRHHLGGQTRDRSGTGRRWCSR